MLFGLVRNTMPAPRTVRPCKFSLLGVAECQINQFCTGSIGTLTATHQLNPLQISAGGFGGENWPHAKPSDFQELGSFA